MTENLRNRWVRRFHPAPGARRRLICFPHAGGSAGYYHSLSVALSPVIEVLVLQYPGRADRMAEEPVTSIAAMADAAHEALRPWLADRPTLFGHSMGAVVAFEVVRRMEREAGRSANRLIASASAAPSDRWDEGIRFLDDDAMLAAIMALGGTDEEVPDHDDLVRLLLPAIRGDLTAIETYRAGPDAVVACPITVFVGDRDPKVDPAAAAAWRRHTIADVGKHVFAGDHFYFGQDEQHFTERLLGVLGAGIR
jgi:surfactin synthase thioesterase subunit